MSPASIHAGNRQITARVVLFITVAITMTLVLFAGGPQGGFVFAQQTTPSTSVKFLNPDADTSTEISAKEDNSGSPTNNSYHLVAWVSNLPAGTKVSFSYRDGSTTKPIGTGKLVPGTETYEFHWLGTDMPDDGEYTLVASVTRDDGTSTGSATPTGTASATPTPTATPLASDTETVQVNNADDPPPAGLDPTTDQAETVEITSPRNGGVLNFTKAAGDKGVSATLQVKHSSGVTELTPYFTLSMPGTEPEWTECEGGAESADDSADGVKCELPPGIHGTQVRGVAVVASDNPGSPLPVTVDQESGDAHRVFGTGASPSPSPSASTTSPSPSASTTSPSPTASTTSPSPTSSSTSPGPSPTQSSASPPPPPPPPPPVYYSTQMTLKIKGKAFVGKAKSDLRKCRKGRKIVLKKQKPGKDKNVGTDKTNKRGKYKIKKQRAKGKYYTVAWKKTFTSRTGNRVTCARDRSPKKRA